MIVRVVAIAILGLLIFGCGCIALRTFIPPPDTKAPDYVNVTREQYNEEHSKWLAKSVEGYEIVVEGAPALSLRNGALWTISVSGDGSVSLVDTVDMNGKSLQEGNTGSNNESNDLNSFTVDALFTTVEEAIKHNEELSAKGNRLYPGDIYLTVSFDPKLGYPNSIEEHPFEGCYKGECIEVFDRDWSIKVSSLEIAR